MQKITSLFTLALILVYTVVLGGETISTQEVESYFYADGELKHSGPQFELTYYIEGDTVTRTRVYDIKKKEVIPDNTVYVIQRQLWSDPTKRLMLLGGPVVIRAVGQPGTDAIEILMIGEAYVQSVKSTSDYLVISRQKRIK
jgi:hypothetical protein